MGFIRVIDDCTIGFADFSGNRQYITTGNLAENAKAFLFLMDYARCQRVKLWGHARVVDDDPNLVAQLMPDGYAARSEQAILFKIEAWDVNCPRHIPRKLDAANVADAIVRLPTRIAVLEGRRGMLTGRSYTRANSMASSLSRVMDNAGNVEFPLSNANVPGNVGVTVQVSSTSVKLDPAQLKLAATMIGINGSGQTQVQGAIIQVSASGMAQISGPMIMIG